MGIESTGAIVRKPMCARAVSRSLKADRSACVRRAVERRFCNGANYKTGGRRAIKFTGTQRNC